MRPVHLAAVLDCEFLGAETGHHTPVMLWGPPGVGKSDIVGQIAERHNVPVLDIRLSQMEPSDLRGIPFRSGDLVEWAVPAMLPDAKRHGTSGVLFLDEITSAPPPVFRLRLINSSLIGVWVSTKFLMAGRFSQPVIAKAIVA